MDSESEKEISRRSLLKKIGTGAAIAWAAPVLSSFGARAYASTKGCITCDGGPGTGCSVGGDDCFGQVDCSPPGNFCTCLRTTEDTCFCHQPQSCTGLQPCTASTDCPSGWACTYSCCGGPYCLPPCTGGGKYRRRLKGRTSIGVRGGGAS